MTTTRITHIGGPTALIEVGWRLLTDPTFDTPPGAAGTASAGAPAHP
jgi:L-ascorbate metabolism protein UlaG (beta-lactamase superfamily)